ncbi:MAG: thiamine pyrophosphate-dependent enzyme, partial [Fibrobacter sp.]|nr:thiamine pyrophosphate-dependent enzyme [Fibrobacter sp.]
TIIDFAKSVKKLVVIEELDPFLENHIRQLGIDFISKDESFRIGELKPEYIPQIIDGQKKVEVQSGARKPVLCQGCPHRFVFTALKKLKVFVAGDIGCYSLGATPPLLSLHTCVCMGAGVTFNEGLRRAHPENKNIVGVLGDSTFIHSGITGLINAVYNDAKGVIIILDNSTTAMTGGQDHPATGKTIIGRETHKLVLEKLVESCGVNNVDVISPYKYKEFESLVKQRLSEDALSVIIAREPCRLVNRTRKPIPEYDQSKCKKCGLCLSIDCPGITKEENGYVKLNEELCTGCNLCAHVCLPKALRAHE